ncbi:MAG: class I SAM-dependent methyltransferase, partial [Desulfobacterales bacterium]|nr:class I SAM-dependent methyltransferase [Desulfobacterales bacterium]
ATKLVPKFECVIGNIYNLPITTSAYDLVICTEVLEQLNYPDLALSEITRVGNGYYFFSVPNEPLWRLSNLARGAYLAHWGNSPGHLNHWNTDRFIKFLSRYTTILQVKRSYPWILTLCHK